MSENYSSMLMSENYLYIYKVGAFFDLLGRTPPRPLALEG